MLLSVTILAMDTTLEYEAGTIPQRLGDRTGSALAPPTQTPTWHPVSPRSGETERQVGPLECTSARKADSGTHGGGGAGKILKKIQAWLSIRRQGVRRL